MEAAAIPWRPLGRLLVEQGLLTDEELELALAKQQVTGRRLGETIVECGFVSRPDLSNALAAQYGIQLTTETGFGTGLRAQIQQRHENDRGRAPLTEVPQLLEPAIEIGAETVETESPPPAEAMLLAQLEEQWAKLAAAEEQLAEREAALATVAAERDERRAQAERLFRRARSARAEENVQRERNEALTSLTQAVDGQFDVQRAQLAAVERRLAERELELAALSADRERRRAQAARFVQRVRARDTELERRNEELKGLTDAVDGQFDVQRAQLAAVERRLAERDLELAALSADRERRRAQAVRFARRVRTRGDELARRGEEVSGLRQAADGLRDRAERLAGDVRGCDAEIERLRSENLHRRAQAAGFAMRLRELRRGNVEEHPVVTPSSHLVFLQLAGGYELVERDGPPPARHSPLELPGLCDGTLVVAGSRPSPFPGDARPCIVAQPA